MKNGYKNTIESAITLLEFLQEQYEDGIIPKNRLAGIETKVKKIFGIVGALQLLNRKLSGKTRRVMPLPKKSSDAEDDEKKFLVIGSNNFWYSIESSLKNAVATAKYIRKDHAGYADPETGHEPELPEKFYIYEAVEKKEL